MNNLRQNIDIKNTLQTSVYITPQMKQSIAMLQMPIFELAQEISTILEENPVLETFEQEGDSEDYPDEREQNDSSAEADEAGDKDKPDKLSELAENITGEEWEEYIGYEKIDDISYKPMSDDEDKNFEEFIGATESLFDYLMRQLSICDLSENEKAMGEYIIGNLNEDGYFCADIQQVSAELGVDVKSFEKVLSIVKTFDPSGIASGNLAECIVTQMIDSGCDKVYGEFAQQILQGYADELATFKYDEILKGMSIERDTFDYIFYLIKKTDPRPGFNFSTPDNRYVTPDVFIIPNGDKFDVLLNEQGVPPIRLNEYYLRMAKGTNLDSQSKQYIKEKIKNALWVIESLQKRQKAIYKVVHAIVDFQKDYFRNGIAHLKPLRMKDVAETTLLHESTVSRVVSGKYAMTENGLMELKTFFAKSFDVGVGDMSQGVVKNKIKAIIDSEDPHNPLSDQRIVEMMEDLGVEIARRTVAKYRDAMNIPTMSQRKRLRR